MSTYTIAVVGNPNTGKTTFINTISGHKLKIGNWPGVTVTKKTASFQYEGNTLSLVDLPGVYDLHGTHDDEMVTNTYLKHEQPDLLINVIDATNLQSNLALTLALLSKGLPMLIILNFWGEFQNEGHALEIAKLSDLIQCPIITADVNDPSAKASIPKAIMDASETRPIPSPIAGNRSTPETITAILSGIYTPPPHQCKKNLTDHIDAILLNRFLSFPLMALMFYGVFKITFDGSSPFIDWIDGFFNGFLAHLAQTIMLQLHAPPLIQSLVLYGIIAGIGTVLTFIPLLFLLYFFLSILEESGCIARVAYSMDRLIRPLGLQGKAFIPLLIGFGCNVPAIYASRTLTNTIDRKITASITSFMSCGAKLPIYVLFSAIFFPRQTALVALSLYGIGIITAAVWVFLLQTYVYKNNTSTFIIELPQYRIPSLSIVLNAACSQSTGFIKRAGTMITIIVILIWSLSNIPYGSTPEHSLLGRTARAIAPIFQPLGWGDSWQATSAVIPGFLAKEAVVGALATAYSKDAGTDLPLARSTAELAQEFGSQLTGLMQTILNAGTSIISSIVPGVFAPSNTFDTRLSRSILTDLTPLKAYSFMVFNLLLVSCVAVMGAIKQEFGPKFLVSVLAISFTTAYIVSLVIYQVGSLL